LAKRTAGVKISLAREEIQLRRGLDPAESLPLDALPRDITRLPVRRKFRLLEVAQDGLGTLDNRLWHACQARDVDAVALVRATLDDLVQEHDLLVPLADGDVEVAQAR